MSAFEEEVRATLLEALGRLDEVDFREDDQTGDFLGLVEEITQARVTDLSRACVLLSSTDPEDLPSQEDVVWTLESSDWIDVTIHGARVTILHGVEDLLVELAMGEMVQ